MNIRYDDEYIQRKRVGEIRNIDPVKNFGFISGEDFRGDVFFHMSVWESDRNMLPEIGMVVEFEINQEHLRENDSLRATVVRQTNRPYTKQLDLKADDSLTVKHHPNARKRKPVWRGKKT
ncbi:cold shock domain-containing protein [Rosistilla ulvae]|uniref:cold shock domain-containing protein n=1 Tax=Rosistilla ulvae TaxID=1930277 RepID=UPI001FE3563B|nr:cold shock domain-containing protein [Rosistilla ulvae]